MRTLIFLFIFWVSPLVSEQLLSRDLGILGALAPQLKISQWFDEEGKPLKDPSSILDWKGKVVFILCWQSWCPGCHSSGLPTLKELSDHFQDNPGIQFLSIQTVFEGHGVNTVEKVPKTMKSFELRVPSGHDFGSQHPSRPPDTMRYYRTGGTPWVIIIDKRRRVVYNDFRVDPKKAIPYLQKLIDESLGRN